MNGLKLVAVLSSEEMMQVESPKHKIELKPPLYNDFVLERSLVQRRRPDSSDLGIVNPVLRGITQALAATSYDMNSCSSGL